MGGTKRAVENTPQKMEDASRKQQRFLEQAAKAEKAFMKKNPPTIGSPIPTPDLPVAHGSSGVDETLVVVIERI